MTLWFFVFSYVGDFVCCCLQIDDKPLIGSIISLRSISNLDKKYCYVYCESITDSAPANNIQDIRCIFVYLLDSDSLQEGSTIDEAIQAQQAGVRSAYVSFNNIQSVVAVGRDKAELEKSLSLVIVKDCKSEKNKNDFVVLIFVYPLFSCILTRVMK